MSAAVPGKSADTSAPVHPVIAERWSPRAFDPDAPVGDEQLRALLEAARWAPSYGNTQPARFLIGRRGDEVYERIHRTLNSGNQRWAGRAGVLLAALAVTRNDKGTVPLAEYGVGLATENLVLQAVDEGLAAHQMAGFDAGALRDAFELPEHVVPLVVVAVGVQAPPETLTEQRDFDREVRARERIPLGELALTGWDSPAF